MKILAFDTATDALCIALDGSEYVENHSQDHLSKLVPKIKELLEKNNAKLDDIGLIAIGTGPGSFTGLRIGISAAKTLSQVKGIKLAAIPTLDTIAYFQLPTKIRFIAPLVDAKKHRIFTALYDNSFKRVTDYLDLCPDEFSALTENYQEVLLAGNGIKVLGDVIKDKKYIIADESKNHPSAKVMVGLAPKYEPVDFTKLEPMYIRRSDAESK